MIGLLIGMIVLAALDQCSKILALTYLKPVGNITVIDGVFDLTFVENRGAASGMLEGQRWFFVAMTIAVTIGVFWYFRKKANPKEKGYQPLRFAFMLLLGGAWGNAIDRLFRGYVVDYFEFTFISYPVFNVADIGVVVGVILMAILLLFVIKEEGSGS